jgi:hypothetical protein
MIQFTRDGVRCDEDLGALRASFEANHVVRLPALLPADALQFLHRRMAYGTWIDYRHGSAARELLLDDEPAIHLLHFLVGAPDFLDLARRITGHEAIHAFIGRIYRFLPIRQHLHRWHDDLDQDPSRLVGMSINLGTHPYEGGVFQMRQLGKRKPLGEWPNLVPGDATLFRIDPGLQHRVTPVTGSVPKTAFAGWFRSAGTDFLTTIRLRSDRARSR